MNTSFQTRIPPEPRNEREAHSQLDETYSRQRQYPIDWLTPKKPTAFESFKSLLWDLVGAFFLAACIFFPFFLWFYRSELIANLSALF
jgi:hypothetical protein